MKNRFFLSFVDRFRCWFFLFVLGSTRCRFRFNCLLNVFNGFPYNLVVAGGQCLCDYRKKKQIADFNLVFTKRQAERAISYKHLSTSEGVLYI